MIRLLYLALIALTMLAGCDDANCVFDTGISALNRQTKVLEKQNIILERIATTLEKQEGGAK